MSPSDSTLKREFSLDPVAIATLLTKSSFRGGGWLAQKLRELGEGVRSEGFISETCYPASTKIPWLVGTPPDLLMLPLGFWYPEPPQVFVMEP